MHTSELVPVMMTYIPKQLRMGERSRSAAIWALGILYREKPDQELTKKLYERATDPDLYPPENMRVKRISVVSLGRLKAVEYANELRRLASNDPFGQAIRWAVKEITGEILPDPGPYITGSGSWFLEPLDDAESPARP